MSPPRFHRAPSTSPDPLPVIVEVSHPVTDRPTWRIEWNGQAVSEIPLPGAPGDAGLIADWAGGPDFDRWCETFAAWDPWEVATEMVDQLRGGGFNARIV